MVCFIDIHAHLDADEFSEDLTASLARAKVQGVLLIINQGINAISNSKSLSLAKAHDTVLCACGLYPLEAVKISESEFKELLNFIRKNKKKIIAIGEVGLDRHWGKDEDNFQLQKKRFGELVKLGVDLDKPLIVHSRAAESETIGLLQMLQAKKVIMHCFGGKVSFLKSIVDAGWHISIPTSIVYDEHFQRIAQNVPLSHIFCETDSPYLGPNRGERNEPANVVEGYKTIAKLKGMDLIDVKNNIFLNYQRLFD